MVMLVRLGLGGHGGRVVSATLGIFFTWCVFNSNNFVVSAALVEVCTLLSAILVKDKITIW